MAGDSVYHEILMPDGKRFRVKKEDWDAKTDKYIHKLSAGKIRMTDSKGNNSYVPVSEYGDAVQNKNMHALRIGWTMNDNEATLTRSSYKDVYKPAKVAAQPKSQQVQQVQQPQTQSKAQQTQPTARQTQAQPKVQQVQVAQQRPGASRQQVVQSAQAPQTKQVRGQQAQQAQAQQAQSRQATRGQQAQSKGSGASGVLKTAKLRRGGKDYEIPWQEINAEGGLGKYIANHDSKEAPIRVYMRDAKGKLLHVDARQVNNYRGKGYKFEVGKAKRWQPTVSEKAAKMAEIQEMANNAKDVMRSYQRSANRAAGLPEDWNWDDKTNYEQGHAAIEQEKNRRKAAVFGAQLQGVNTKPMGLFSGGGLSGSNGGEKTSSQQGQSPFAMANAKSPEVNRVVMKDGKPTVEWVLPDGSVTTDIMEADKAEYYARKERGRRSGEEELRNMGLNPLSPMAISTQRAWNNLANEWGEKQAAQIREMLGNSDATKQAWEITDQLYKEADGEMKAAAKRNDEATAAITGIFGEDQEQSVIRQTERLHKNYVDYLTLYDLMDMSDKVWGMMDEDKKDELRKTAREQGYTSAEDIEKYARAKSDEVVYDYAKRRNAPKNVLDLFVHRVIGANTVTSLAKGLMRMGTKKQGDLDAKEMAYAEYGKEHPGWNIAGNVVGIAADIPLTGGSAWVGSKAGKFALSLYGRRLEKMYQLAKGAGKGIAAAKGTGKLLAGIAGGAGNFATFEAGGEIKQQIEKGGAVGDDGRVHGYSAGRVIGAAVKGAGMGAVMGAGSHYISKGAAKAISKTDNVWGKAGIASGRTLTNTLWSATVLSIPEWVNGEQSPMDVWLENIGTMGGFGLMHGINAAPRVIRELAPVKNPTTAAERLHNRTSFMERVDNVLSAGTVDTWLTQSDYTELMANGYGDFYDLFKARDKEGFVDTKTKYSKDPRTQEYKDAFGRMEEFVKDERVSQRLRSKMYSMLTGRGLPISGYVRAEYGETPEGEGYVATFTPDGRLVTFDLYKDEFDASKAANRLKKECQRYAVGYAEDLANGVADNELLIESIIRVYAKRNPEEAKVDEDLVNSLVEEYRATIVKPKDELTSEESAYLDMVNAEIIANHSKQERRRPEGARLLIKENYGVDVDEALRKGIDKQTEREAKAIEEYVRLLMPKEEEFNRMYDGEFITYTDEGKPDDPDDPNGNNGGGEVSKDDVPPVEPTDPNGGNERNEGNDGNVGNEGNERGVSPADGVPPADIQPEQTKVSAHMQAAIDEYNAALEELTRFVGEENADKIINEIGAKEYLGYLKGEGISSGAEFDAVNRLIAADEAIDQINRDTERDLGYQNGKKAAEQMTDEELAAELMKASEEANDSMPTEFNLGYLNAISDTLRDRQKEVAEGNWAPKEGEPNEPKDEPNEPKDDGTAGEMPNEGNESNDSNVGNVGNERNERNVGNGELPGNLPVEDAPTGEGDAPAGEGDAPAGEGDAPTGEGELGNKSADDSALSRVPVGEDGEPNFLAVDTETGWDALVEMIGNEDGAKAIAEAQADQAGKNVAAIRKREPQKGKVKLTGSVTAMAEAYKNAEKKYEEDHAAWESEMSAAVAKHERWQALAAEPEVRRKAAEEAEAKRKAEEEERARAEEAERRRKAAEAERIRIAEEKERKRIEAEERKRIAKGDRELAKAYDRCKKYPEALEILRDDQPHDIYEAVSVALSGHKILLNNDGARRGYKHETGLGEGERKRFFRMFATRENGGISIARLAEDIVQEICDVNGIRYDNNDARGIIIEMLASSDGPSDIYNYIRNRRIEQANSIVDRYEYEEECSLREDFWYEMHMTPEEWDVYNDYREEELKELDNHFRDFDFSEHYANIAERIEKEYANDKNINRTGESDAEGGGDQANVSVGTLVRGEGLPKEGSSGEVSTGFENVKKDLLRSPDHGERLDREAAGEGSDVGSGQAERGNSGALPEGVTEDGDVNGLAWGKDRVSHDNYGREIVHRNMYYNGDVIGVYYGKESGNLLRDGVEEYAISVPGLETKEDLMLPLYDADGKDVREGGKEAPYKLDAGWISFNTKEDAVDFYKRNKDAIDKFNEAADADVSAEMRTLAKSLLDDKSLVEYANSVVYSKPGDDVGNGAEMGAELGKLVCERLLKDNPDLSTKELFKVGNLFLGELLSPLNSENKGKQVRTSMVMPYYDALKERPETTLNRRLEMLKEKGVTSEGNPLNIDELADAYLNANREYNESYIDFLEDKIDENEWRRRGDELNKKVQSARKELEDAILSLSDGELKSVGAAKDIEDVVNSILKDREENNRLADDFERLIETQGEIVGKSKSKYKLADIIDKKTDTKQLLGIYHDGGYAVASDKIVLVADKREYDEANDGKIVGLDGSVVDGQYPTWRAVMPKQISEIGFDPKGMLDFITGVKAKAKSINPKQKRSELYVLINIGGNIQSYSLNQLEKFCNAAVSLDAKLYIMQREDSLVTLYAEGKNGCALIMPTTRPDFPLINENGVYAYNKPAANGEPKASVWAGDAEGGKRLSEGDGDIGNNSGDGVEDYAEMDEYVPQTWDENSSLRDVEARLKLLEDAFYYPWEALGKKIFPEYIDFINEKGDLKDKYGSGDKVPKEEADALFAKYAGYIERYNAMREEIYSLRELRDRLEAKMSREQKEEESRREMAELLAKHNGYLRGMSNLRMWSVDRYLSKLKKIDGEVATVSEFIDRWLADGSLRISKREYKPQIDRRKWNRMSGQEQAAWEASHNKPKTEYLVNDYDLGKTAYDYARWLLSQKEKGKLGDVVKEQKVVGAEEVSPREAALRDSLIGVLRDAGVEVVTDVAEGQRVLDKANGDAKVQAKIVGNEQKLRQHKVYHGSGADFDAFDNNHMSEGEGAQAYGWGTYVTEVEAIGRNYAIVNNNSLRKSKLESDIYRLKEALPFRRGEAKREGEEELKRLEEELSKFDETWRSVLYTVEIPDDTGSNYLHWDKPVGREKSDKISKALYDRILREDKDGSYEDEYSRAALRRELDSLSGIDGKDLYGTISAYLGGDKAASEFLRDNGFVGVSYPSQYRSGGRKDAARNYVVFDEKDMEITDKVKFFRTADGDAYGFTIDGKIYIDPRIATAETPIHEYAHLWSAFMRKANPKGWGDIVKLMKECTDLWDQVARDYPELKTEDDIAEEVLTHYSGRRGAERLRAEMQRAMESAGKDVKKQTMIASMFEGVRRALSRFWRGVADLFHIRFTSAEDVADRVLADMLNGFNPVEAGKKAGVDIESGDTRYQVIGEKGAGSLDRIEEATVRLDNLGVARNMEASGKDAKTIRLATGWERGGDGKWRYEVPDEIDFSDDQILRKAINSLEKNFEEVTELKLSDVFGQDNSLFKAYPELADVVVKFEDRGYTSVLASISDDGKEIWINPNNWENQSGLFLHEVQHVIQQIEGFAKGGNSGLFENPKDHKYANLPGKEIKKMRESAEFARKELSKYDTFEDIKDYYKSHRSQMTESERGAIVSVLESVSEGLSVKESISELEKEYKQAMEDLQWSLTSKESPYNKYLRLGGEVEARNVQERMYMSEEERRNTLLSETEDVAREDQIFLQDSLGENQMGSRVDSRMAEIGDYYVGRDLDDNARAIVDVYSGKADNKTVTVMRDGKVHKVVMRQGNENNAGAKHSLFRHYGTNVGVITKDDLLLIPEVIKKGEMQNKGSRRAYKLSVNGVNYTIITEKKHNREEFFDFYSNRKGDQTRTLNTQLSARDIQIGHQDATKLAKEFDNSKFGEKKAEKSEYDIERERAGVAEVKDSFERYRGRNPRARQLSLFDDDSKAQPEARQLSLFDDAEVDGSGRIIEPERQAEMDRNAEKVNSSLDEFTDEYAEYLRLLDETEGSEDFVPEEAEARVMDLRDKLVEDMMEYHRSAGMGEAEARKRSWELVNQTMTDINIALLRKGKSGNIELLPEDTIKVKRMNESEETKEWLPELGEGEFCYMERKFSEDKSFVFSAPEHIESMDDVAYIFKQLEKYSVEHSFLALVKDGKVTVVHLGMGNATSAIVNMAAARAALDKFDPDMVYFVHNHPSGVLTASIPDVDSLQTLRDMTKGKVECEALIIDTLSGKYAQFGLDGKSRILDLPKGYDSEVDVKVQAHDKMEYAPDFTPDKKEQTNSAGDIVKYVSSLRVGVGDKVGVLVMNQQNHILANLYLPMEEDMRVLGDDIAGKVVLFGGNRVIVYTNNGQMLEVGKTLEDAIKRRSGKSVLLLDVLRLKKDGDYQALSESVFETEGEYGNKVRYNMGDGSETFADRQRRAVENKGTVMPGLNSAVVKVVEVPRHDFTGTGKQAIESAIQWAKENIVGVQSYVHEGFKSFDYRISNKSVDKYLSYSSISNSDNMGVHLAVLKKLPEVISESIEVEEHPDYSKDIDGKRRSANHVNDNGLIHRFFGAVSIDGKKYRVKTTIKEYSDRAHGPKAYNYEVTKIELIEAPFTGVNNSSNQMAVATINSIPVANILKNVDKSYDSGKKVLAESRKADSFEPTSTNQVDMKAEAERLSAELNTPVRIITDSEEAASLPTVRQRRAKGFWSEKDGIVVVLSNHKDVADVAGTVLHEIVGHDGLRVLFPEKEKLDNALDELYGVSHDKIRTEIDSRTDKIFKNEVDRIMERKRKEHETKGESANYFKDLAEAHAEAEKKRAEMRREATEEYGAGLADRIGEDGFKRMDAEEATFWGKFKAMLQKAFDSLLQGLRIKRGKKWTDKEWAFVLHEAWKRKRNGDNPSIKDMADTEAMRNRTGFNQVERYSESISKNSNIDKNNRRFNEELQQQIDGTLPAGHVYRLGNPGTILRSTGIPDLPIEMKATRLKEKATSYGHDFDLIEVKDLVKAMQEPLAVFEYGNKSKAQNIIVHLQKDGKNFVVGMSLNPKVHGSRLEINSIRNVFPKNNAEWLNWINKGLALYLDKEKIQNLIDQQRTILADVEYLDLDSIAKVIENFENPTILDEESDIRYRDDEGLDEAITRMKVEEAAKNAGNLEKRDEAIRAIKLYREYCRGYPASNRSGKSQICSEWRAKDFALRQLWC